ncbi:GyrI-like domain-containing protein [Chelatococcus reniformis]|uniref:AraC family transcriptional regulator n=1 Tax=Chelatococcus reniformis TaxID=1494448 RepID=A0A916TXG6_9HYPH|nr:GyrI-like domain-containing protein [Chelatococcus reniformis]GGC49702.1 AraC family transcriptional regulator [Chelatococcus reniformis]
MVRRRLSNGAITALVGSALLVGALAGPGGASAQTMQPAPTAGEGAPKPADAAPPPAPPDTGQPAAPAPAPPAAGGTQAVGGLPTLVPGPTDSGNIDEVVLPAKPAAVLSGKTTWDEGFKTIFASFKTIESELVKAGIKPAGRPLTIFVNTDDTGFSFEAMVPIAAVPEGKSELTPTIKFGPTPAGKALRFTHRAPYDDIDNTYEAITAYLDAKDIAVKDSFIEEYGTDPKDPSDPDLQINIFVQPSE